MEFQSEIDESTHRESKKTPTEKLAKVKGSAFLITINSNKSERAAKQEVIDRIDVIKKRFIDLANVIYSKENFPRLLLQLQWDKESGPKPKKIPIQSTENIISLKIKTQIESGSINGFIHMQTAVSVKFKNMSGIQINSPKLKQIVYKSLEDVLTFGGKKNKPYVNVMGTKSMDATLMSYVTSGI